MIILNILITSSVEVRNITATDVPAQLNETIEQVLHRSKKNYKVYAEIGLHPRMLRYSLTVLDTGAGINFERKSALADGWNLKLKPKPTPEVCDANKRMLNIFGVIGLIEQFGRRIVKIEFNVCERLSAPSIIGCTFMDRLFEAINPKQRRILLDDGTVVPIVWKPIDNPPEPKIEAEENTMAPSKDRRVQLANRVSLSPNSQSWISLVAPREGTQILQPVHRIYQSREISVRNRVVYVEEGKPFKALMEIFTNKHVSLVKGMVAAHLLPHPFAAILTRLAVADVFGADVEEGNLEGYDDVDELLSADLRKFRELRPDRDGKPKGQAVSSVEDLNFEHIPELYREKARSILRKHSEMWDGGIGNIETAEHAIGLLPEANSVSNYLLKLSICKNQFTR